MAFATVLVAAMAAVAVVQIRHPQPLPDPAADAVRVEIRLSTDARSASVRVLGDFLAVAEGRRLAGPADLRTAVLENLLALSGNAEGSPATGVYRLVLTNVAPGTAVPWSVNVQGGRRATLEVWNLNDEQRPMLVDRFESASGVVWTSSTDRLRAGGPLPAAPRPPRLVLGHYYPWYDRTTWADAQMLDQPRRLWSTDVAADVRTEVEDAARAGLDGLIVSWQGRDVGDGWNYRRMLLVLEAAQQAGLTACVQLETLAANRAHIEGAPAEVDVLVEWLVDIVDLLGAHPAYLRVDGRPVVFAYSWDFAGTETWRAVQNRLRATGRNPFVLAETTNPAELAWAEGIFTYAATLFVEDVGDFSRELALASRTYHLLGADRGPRRVAMATVSPGYDETRLNNRPLDRVVEREGGAFYDAQWAAALGSGADWVLVTSWNEWWENTQVAPGQRHGDYYVWRTRFWSAAFTRAPE